MVSSVPLAKNFTNTILKYISQPCERQTDVVGSHRVEQRTVTCDAALGLGDLHLDAVLECAAVWAELIILSGFVLLCSQSRSYLVRCLNERIVLAPFDSNFHPQPKAFEVGVSWMAEEYRCIDFRVFGELLLPRARGDELQST